MIEPLDPRQVAHIESVHRGFLYQHLYAVGCLFLADHGKVRSVTVELDEDVELELDNRDRVYVQIKTRTSPLILSDIASALDRFEQIRFEHQEGHRLGTPSFVVISNVAPGPELITRIDTRVIPPDVLVLWPGAIVSAPACLPPAWPNLSSAMIWCADQARTLPMAMLEPETLVWKLAGRVLLAATGQSTGHSFNSTDLCKLFEQLAVQLQQFPAPPEVYLPLDDEPILSGGPRVRIVSGFSGAGKTAWAAHATMHLGSECAYYDIGDVPGSAIAASLVRELAAQWAAPTLGGLRQVILPGASGIEVLRALDNFLGKNDISALVVLDNAHRVPASDLRMLIEATQHLQFVLLAQPSTSIAELEATVNISHEVLRGWGLDQAAAEVQAQGAKASVNDLGRLLALTGGLPLYVRTAAQLSTNLYDGDISAMCLAFESHSHLTETAQEMILSRSFDTLSEQVCDCVAVMSLCDAPLTSEEAARLVKTTFNIEITGFAGVVRQLRPLGVVRIYGKNRLQIHDAFRVIGLRRFAEKSKPQIKAGHEALKEIILESFQKHRDHSRFSLLIRTLVELGELKALIEIATEEWFHELGISSGIWVALESASLDERIDAEQRFYALDGLVFAEMKAGDEDKLEKRLQIMEMLVDSFNLDYHARLTLLLKRMMLESGRGNEALTIQILEKAKALAADTPEHQRIIKYNIASAFFMLKHYVEAESILHELVIEYYDVLKLTLDDVIGKSNRKIAEKLRQTPTLQDDLKHLADALNLLAQTTNAQGRDSKLARIHAVKFYDLAHAFDSLIRVLQDLVDEFIGRSDYIGAKQLIEEHLLPAVIKHKMLDKIISVRSQYAVVLAYCGKYDDADIELGRLNPFWPGLTKNQIAEIENQRDLVNKLRYLRVRPEMVNITPAFLPCREISRNVLCLCGSGKRYKHCHGRT